MIGVADNNIGHEEVRDVGGAPDIVAPMEPVVAPAVEAMAQPPQHRYNLHPHQACNYSHWYGDDEQVDNVSFFQSA